MQVRRVLLSQLEPPEITTVRTLYIYIYIYIVLFPRKTCYTAYAPALVHTHTQNLFVCIHIHKCSQVFTSIHKYSPVFTSIHKYSQVYMYHIIDPLVYQPKLCELTYVCALVSAHTLIIFVYINIFRSVHISYHRYCCI